VIRWKKGRKEAADLIYQVDP